MNQFCDCPSDGYCPRYNRIMSGRFKEICEGTNCDLGTAAAFREQWAKEIIGIPQIPVQSHTQYPQRIPLLLKTDQCPGDAVVMTAAIYSLHKAHPGKYITAVESPYPEVFKYNPDVHEYNNFKTGEVSDDKLNEVFKPLQMHYPAIHQSNERGIHFMQGFTEHLGNALSINVPLLTNRPRLYFPNTDEFIPQGNYWVICSGGKQDLTNKLWGHDNYQQVISSIKNKVQFVQVGDKLMDHPHLDFTEWMVGKTNLRELFDLVRQSRGVVCGVSLLMHVAAALEKPCIVIAGGREPVTWNAYPYQHYLHTVGALPCTTFKGDKGACWRSRVLPLGDGTILDKDTCQRPIEGIPECMRMIKPESVVELVLRYNKQYEV